MPCRWPTPSGRPPRRVLLLLGSLGLMLLLSRHAVALVSGELWTAPRNLVGYLGRIAVMPDWSYVPDLLRQLLTTLEIGFAATFLTVVLSLMLSLLVAGNATPHPVLGFSLRGLLSLLRAIPELVWAWVFVILVSLGSTAGVLALALVGTTILTKFFAENLEVVDPRPVEGILAQGAGPLQVRMFGLLPQALPDHLSASLYLLDHNVRSATMVGIVGAGGIGYDLKVAIDHARYDRLSLIIVGLFLLVASIDYLSGWVRRRVI